MLATKGFGQMFNRNNQVNEAFVNNRELATKGMYLAVRGASPVKVGSYIDWYDKKTGDKKEFIVKSYDGKSITLLPTDSGRPQKFTITY